MSLLGWALVFLVVALIGAAFAAGFVIASFISRGKRVIIKTVPE